MTPAEQSVARERTDTLRCLEPPPGCLVCGADRLVRQEYKSPIGQCPAAACEQCGALRLDETMAETDNERESVRTMRAARATCLGLDPRQR